MSGHKNKRRLGMSKHWKAEAYQEDKCEKEKEYIKMA